MSYLQPLRLNIESLLLTATSALGDVDYHLTPKIHGGLIVKSSSQNYEQDEKVNFLNTQYQIILLRSNVALYYKYKH